MLAIITFVVALVMFGLAWLLQANDVGHVAIKPLEYGAIPLAAIGLIWMGFNMIGNK